MSSVENTKIKLQGVQQLLNRLSAAEGENDNEMFLMLSDVICENYVVIGALASGDPIMFEKGKEQISIYNREDDRIEEDEG